MSTEITSFMARKFKLGSHLTECQCIPHNEGRLRNMSPSLISSSSPEEQSRDPGKSDHVHHHILCVVLCVLVYWSEHE